MFVGSKLLYELYKSSKQEADREEELDPEESLGKQNSVLRILIQKVGQECGIPGVIINHRLIQEFKTKIWRLNQALAKAKTMGGNGVKKLFSNWTRGKFSTWNFKIYYYEMDCVMLQNENNELRGQKRKLEDDLKDEKCKKAKIEQKMKEAVAKNKDITSKFQKKFKGLVQKLMKLQKDKKSRGPTKSKTFLDYSKRHQTRVRKQMVTDCETSLSFLGLHNFVATKVEIFHENTQEYETLTLVDNNNIQNSSRAETVTDEEIDDINLLLYTKERFNISNEAYHELSMICKELPRSWKVKERIKALNSKWNLSSTPNDTCGIQQSIEERLEVRLQTLMKNSPNAAFKENHKIRVKLSGDGTNIGKRLHVINVTFTVLDEGTLAQAAGGNHLIAVIKEPENYETLSKALTDIRKDVESLKHLSVGTEQFEIEWFLGGDWKFLACVCGLGAAHATYPCIWCKCPLYDKYDGRKEWSLTDVSKGARSIEEIQQQVNTRSRTVEKYNSKHAPLFPSIPIDHVVIDSLHLFLRISDNLINLVIQELRRQDALDKNKTFNDGFNRSKYKHMAGWETYLNDTLKIPFNWFVCKDSKKLKWRDLTGPEKQKLFRNIDFTRVLPNHQKSDQISQLWKQFLTIANMLSSTIPQQSKEEIQEASKSFLEQFLKLYHTKHVTPYMHALVWHVPEFIQMYGTISSFTQQGLEKLNDKTTKDFFRSTNQRGMDALKQIVQKRNRIEYFEDLGSQRGTRSVTCGNCKLEGHNIKTCLSPCSSCAFKPCCSPLHVIKSNSKWVTKCQNENISV